MTALCQALPAPGPASPCPAAVLQPGPHMAAPTGRRPTALPLCPWQRYVPMEKHGFHPIPGPLTICKHSALSLLSSQQPMLFLFASSQTVGTIWQQDRELPMSLHPLGTVLSQALDWFRGISTPALLPPVGSAETDIVLRADFRDCHGCCIFT